MTPLTVLLLLGALAPPVLAGDPPGAPATPDEPSWTPTSIDPTATAPYAHPVTITLVDASILHATVVPMEIPLSTAIGEVSISLSAAAQWERPEGSTDGRVDRFVVSLRGGDRITGFPRLPHLEVGTILGPLAIPFSKITSLTIDASLVRIPRRGPILHFDLRGYSPSDHAGVVRDRSGLGNDGRFIGADPRPAGTFTQSCIEVPFDAKNPLFPTSTPFTVSVTFRTTCSDPSEATPREMMLWSTHFAGTGTDGAWLMVDTAAHGGRMRFFVGPGHTEVVGETVVADGKWHTAVASWDGTRMRLVVDGELEGSAETRGALVYTHRAPMRIGYTHASGAVHAKREKYFFRGEIGDVRIYERALEPAEGADPSVDSEL